MLHYVLQQKQPENKMLTHVLKILILDTFPLYSLTQRYTLVPS